MQKKHSTYLLVRISPLQPKQQKGQTTEIMLQRHCKDTICLYFYLGMDCWPLCTGPLWWFSWGFGPLSHQYGKIGNSDSMTRGDKVVMYRGRGIDMFLKALFKISCWLFYIFLIRIHPVTFISIYDPTFFKDWIFILWSHEEVFDSMTSFEMYFYPIFLASSLEALTQPLMVRYNNVWFWHSAVVRSWFVDVFFIFLQVRCLALQLNSLQCPVWVLAFS